MFGERVLERLHTVARSNLHYFRVCYFMLSWISIILERMGRVKSVHDGLQSRVPITTLPTLQEHRTHSQSQIHVISGLTAKCQTQQIFGCVIRDLLPELGGVNVYTPRLCHQLCMSDTLAAPGYLVYGFEFRHEGLSVWISGFMFML